MLSDQTKSNIQEDVQNAFGTLLQLSYHYGDTRRKSGDVLSAGEPRDMIDEGDVLGSLEIEEFPTKISITFDDPGAVHMDLRPELVEEIVSNLDIRSIASDMIRAYLSNKKI